MKIIKKCWAIDLNRIEEGRQYSPVTAVADNKNKAKTLLLNDPDSKSMSSYLTGEYLTYTTIPIIRYSSGDLVEYKGQTMPMYKYEQVMEREKHDSDLNAILQDEAITHCYIRKRGCYYLSGMCGYSEYRVNAFPYPKQEAVTHARGVMEISLVPVDTEAHNAEINKRIEQLKANLLP